jgi:hypothetical protein
METQIESAGSSFYTAVVIFGALALLGLGIWVGLSFKPTAIPGTAKPGRHPHPDPGPDPGPDPYDPGHHPHPHPDPGPNPKPKPGPTPRPSQPFNPTLKLTSAIHTPNTSEVHVKYTVDSDDPVPPTRMYSVVFDVMINNKPFTNVPDVETLEQGDIGFEKEILLQTTGQGSTVEGIKSQVRAQIRYHEIGSPASGTIGTPEYIDIV